MIAKHEGLPRSHFQRRILPRRLLFNRYACLPASLGKSPTVVELLISSGSCSLENEHGQNNSGFVHCAVLYGLV